MEKEELQESKQDLDKVGAIILMLKDTPKDRIAHILKTVAVWYDVENP